MAWDDVKNILRPEGVHMGVMKADADKCTQCGLCIENCPFSVWEMGDDAPRMKDVYECFSCYNCMAACQEDAISIVEGVFEIHRFSINQNKVYLCMRHSQRFNHILYGSFAREGCFKIGLSLLLR